MLHVQLLGGFKINDDDKPIPGLTKPRMQSLLAYLLLHRDAPQSRAHVAYTFWLDSSDSQARTNLRRELLQLRRALPQAEPYLRLESQAIQWNPEPEISLDVADFTATLAEAETSTAPQQRAELLGRAADMYQGDLLPGLYDEWILSKREELAQGYVQALEGLLALHTDERNYPAAIQAAQRLLRYDPLYEAGYYRLMELYAYQDQRARALHTYHTCASVLERELGVEPGPEIQRLYQQLYQAEAAVDVEPSRKRTESVQLVGRRREWQMLLAAWREASAGGAQFVLIEGEAGIGKTRLGEELLEWVNRGGIPTARARSYAAEGSLAYAPVIEWLRADAMHARVLELDAPWQTEIARLLPELLSENPKLPHPEPLTESWQRQRLFEALARAVTADAQPKLLLIDDLQWCDQETLAWLRYLLRFQAAAPLLVLGTARPEEIHGDHPLRALVYELASSEQLTSIELAPLSADETQVLAAQVSGQTLGDHESVGLYSASQGNPLFVVEMVRSGYHDQMAGDASETSVAHNLPPDSPNLPTKVSAVIQARLAQLSPTARGLAEVAATVGRAFEFDLLAAAGYGDDNTIASGLDELWRRRIIREQGVNCYDFSHDCIRDVAYAEISPIHRGMLHRRVAGALERLYADDPDVVSGQLALHYERAGLNGEAAGWHLRAAQASLSLHAPLDAISHIRAGVALLEQGPITEARQEMELQLLLVLGEAYRVAYGFASQEYEEVLLRTQALAEEVGDLELLAQLLVMRTEMNIARGRNQEARALVDGALAALEPEAHPQITLRVYRQDARVATHLGDFAHARRSMERSLFGLTPVPDDDGPPRSALILMYGFANLGVLQWLTGDPDLARESAQHALDLARVDDTPFDFTNVLFLTSIVYRNVGDLASVEANAQQMVSLGAKYDLPLSQQSGDIFSGWVLAHQGDVIGGIQQATRGIDGFRHMGHTMYQTHRLAMLVEMHLMAGQTDQAQTVLDEALSISGEKAEHFWDVELYRLGGDLSLARGADRQAEVAYHQAIDVARQQAAKSLELRATTGLCRLWRCQGKTTQAYGRLAELYSWFSEGFDTHDLQAAKALLD